MEISRADSRVKMSGFSDVSGAVSPTDDSVINFGSTKPPAHSEDGERAPETSGILHILTRGCLPEKIPLSIFCL
jgi:hypothetical protein